MSISGKYTIRPNVLSFGEHNEANKVHGRGIRIFSDGTIRIGYYNNGERAPGTNYISIWGSGRLEVGECYLDEDGERCYRGTRYKTDGTSIEFG